MMESSTDALQLETEFLSGVANNLDEAKGGVLRGSTWEVSNHDDGDRLRALLAELPRDTGLVLKGQVGMTSHVAQTIKTARVPSRMPT